MRKTACLILCTAMMLGICRDAYARGGTYHHSDFVPLRSIEITKKPVNATVRRPHRATHRR
jgi:hypothetical protein